MRIESKQPRVDGYLRLWQMAAFGIGWMVEHGMAYKAVAPSILLAASTVIAICSAFTSRTIEPEMADVPPDDEDGDG